MYEQLYPAIWSCSNAGPADHIALMLGTARMLTISLYSSSASDCFGCPRPYPEVSVPAAGLLPCLSALLIVQPAGVPRGVDDGLDKSFGLLTIAALQYFTRDWRVAQRSLPTTNIMAIS